MASQQINTSDSNLDVYLNGIRRKFSRLNLELDEAKHERDEYKRNYMNQAKELQELRQRVGTSTVDTGCKHCKGEGGHNANLPENDTSNEDGARKEPPISGNNPRSLRSRSEATYNVEFKNDTKVALKLRLAYSLTQKPAKTYAAFSMDGKYLATACEDRVYFFDVETCKRLSVIRDLYKSGEDKAAYYRCLCFSADGKFLATGESDGDVKIWIVSQRRVRNTFKYPGSPICGLEFSPNCQWIAIACGQTVAIRRLRDGFSRILKQSRLGVFWRVRFGQDGRYVALSGGNPREARIKIFNVRMGKCLGHARGGHVDAVQDLVFTPNGKGLLSASRDQSVIHWDVSSLTRRLKLTHLGRKGDISTQDLTYGLEEISRFVGHEACAYAISISPDGKWIVSGSLDKTVRIWDANTAKLQCIMHGHGPIMSVDFSRSGDYLAVGDVMGKVTIWNL